MAEDYQARLERKWREEYPPPPEHLSPRAREMWTDFGPIKCRASAKQALFLAGLEAMDRAEECRQTLLREGMTVTNARSGAVHAHPLLAVERASRQVFARIWRDLELN